MFYKDYMDYKDLNSTKFTKVAAPGSLRLVVIFFTGHTVMNQKENQYFDPVYCAAAVNRNGFNPKT